MKNTKRNNSTTTTTTSKRKIVKKTKKGWQNKGTEKRNRKIDTPHPPNKIGQHTYFCHCQTHVKREQCDMFGDGIYFQEYSGSDESSEGGRRHTACPFFFTSLSWRHWMDFYSSADVAILLFSIMLKRGHWFHHKQSRELQQCWKWTLPMSYLDKLLRRSWQALLLPTRE